MRLGNHPYILEFRQRVILAHADFLRAGSLAAAVRRYRLDDEQRFRGSFRHQINGLAEFFFRVFVN